MRERRKVSFIKEIRHMMYGYGDVKNNRYDTAEILEAYTIDYLKTLLTNTMNMAQLKGKTKTEDLLIMLRNDRRKYTRVKDLLTTNEELKNARKLIDLEEFEKE
ncbi:hypothetical protein GVAV_002108 [Gurleya vavrai]